MDDNFPIKTKPIQITLKLSQDGLINFNKISYEYAEPKLWQDALQEVITSKNATTVEIHLPKGKYTNELSPLFRLFNKLRIGGDNLIIREYE